MNLTDSKWEERRVKLAEKYGTNGFGLTLGMAASLSSWATPSARNWKDGRASQTTMDRNARPLNEQVVMLAGWPTPTADSVTGPGGDRGGGPNLQTVADLTPSPDPGPTALGFRVETAKPGQLNPEHSRWLMGYPAEWGSFADTGMRSSRKSAPRSSLPFSKRRG